MTRYLILFVFLVSSIFTNGQSRFFAQKHFDSFAYQDAIDMYEKIWNKDSLDSKIAFRLAESYRFTNNSKKAEFWYNKYISLSDELDANNYFYYSKALQSNEKYEQAEVWMRKFLDNNSKEYSRYISDNSLVDSLLKDTSKYLISICDFNSEVSDFGPSYYKKGIVFSSSRKGREIIKREYSWNNQSFLDVFYVDTMNLNVEARRLKVFNTRYHDGPICFTHEDDEVFITRTHIEKKRRLRRNNKGTVVLKLYHSELIDGEWSVQKLMSINKDQKSSGHPSINKKADLLYFTSDRDGGFGGKDLYVSHKQNGKWSEPKNMGPEINTIGDEMFPYISDNNILYFASSGHPGLGGLDVFSVDLSAKNKLSVNNLGANINSSKDDFALILNANKGYFSSNRKQGESFDDIYSFEIKKLLLKGIVYSTATAEILGNTLVNIYDQDSILLHKVITDCTGAFSTLIPLGKDILISSEKEFYQDGNVFIAKTEFKNKTVYNTKVYQAQTVIKKDEIYVIENIYYDFDKYNIRADAEIELDKIVRLLNDRPSMKIQLRSHTDSRGTKRYNQVLSQNRADSAVEYIILRGVDPDRITAKGFGESLLINKCADGVYCTKQEHQENRRTEFKVIEIDQNYFD